MSLKELYETKTKSRSVYLDDKWRFDEAVMGQREKIIEHLRRLTGKVWVVYLFSVVKAGPQYAVYCHSVGAFRAVIPWGARVELLDWSPALSLPYVGYYRYKFILKPTCPMGDMG